MFKLKLCLLIMLVGAYGTAWAGPQVVCATPGEWPPMEYQDEDGTLTGYTVELMKAAGRVAGFTIEFRKVDETDIVARLKAGEFDAICSSMINAALRQEELDFSIPYFLSRQMLIINSKRKLVASTDWSSMNFGARRGSYGMEAVRAMKGLPSEYDTISKAMDDVSVNTLDGAVCDEPVANYYTKVKYKHGGLQQSGFLMNSPKKPLSVAVAKGNGLLLELLDKGIAAVMVRGIDKELQRKWFIK